MATTDKFRKHYNFFMFLNTATKETPTWTQNKLSNQWTEEPNATSEDVTFISDNFVTKMNEKYSTSLPQIMYTKMGDPLYVYIEPLYRKRATGTAAQTQMLTIYPDKAEGSGFIAKMEDVSFTWGTHDVVAGTIAYTLNVMETTHGTAILSTENVPTFTVEA